MYIGQTGNILLRLFNHAKNNEKANLKEKYIIAHKYANKSLSYLIESDLINRAFAEGKYKILNIKMQSNVVLFGHDFYKKDEYRKDLVKI